MKETTFKNLIGTLRFMKESILNVEIHLDDGNVIKRKLLKSGRTHPSVFDDSIIDTKNGIPVTLTMSEFARLLGVSNDHYMLTRLGAQLREVHKITPRKSNGRRLYDVKLSELFIISKAVEGKLIKLKDKASNEALSGYYSR